MSRNVLILNSNYSASHSPKDILLDTNIIQELHDPKAKHKSLVEKFIQESVANSVNLYFSGRSFEELTNNLIRTETRSYASSINININSTKYKHPAGFKRLKYDLKNQDPNYYLQIHANVDEFIKNARELVQEIPTDIDRELLESAKSILLESNGAFDIADAINLASMEMYGINTICTGDNDFLAATCSVNVIALPKGDFGKSRVELHKEFKQWTAY